MASSTAIEGPPPTLQGPSEVPTAKRNHTNNRNRNPGGHENHGRMTKADQLQGQPSGQVQQRGQRGNRGGRTVQGPAEGLNTSNQPLQSHQTYQAQQPRQSQQPYQAYHTHHGPHKLNELGALKPPPPGLGGGGSFGIRSTGDARNVQSQGGDGKERIVEAEAAAAAAAAEEAEGELCFICASPVLYHSVGPCNHRTCHICSLRLRALYKTRACAHCRTEARFVAFTDDSTKRFEEFVDDDYQHVDNVLGIKYGKQEIFHDTILLLRYNCPANDCEVACFGWPDLHRHVRSVHQQVMCDLCTRNKKVFTHEHELFTVVALRKHEKFGDDHPGAVDQSGFKGHPECGFCRQRFYGDDELYTHCRDKHERCHICDRRSGTRKQQYFVDYNSLEQHFTAEHLVCLDRECLEKKFVVFESEMDLKAHQLEVHPNDMSKDVRRDARRVDISGFDYRTPHQAERVGRGRGRGRDPNAEPPAISTAQPLRRDELAYQRQMAIQSAQSISTRSFGGQLTAPESSLPRANNRVANMQPARNNGSSVDDATLNSSTALSPQDQARRLRHSVVMDRASILLHNDSIKIADFRTRVSAYRTGAIAAPDLIETLFALFDVTPSVLGTLVKELADLYEDDARRAALLKAWNDWRAINEDYPSLPGPASASSPVTLAGLVAGTVATASARRILKLKSSTAQSSRSDVSKQRSWGTAPSASSSAAPIPTSARPKPTNAPWAASVNTTPSYTPVRSSPTPSRPASVAPRVAAISGTDAFPALPKVLKPVIPPFRSGGNQVRQQAWVGGKVDSETELDVEDEGDTNGKKKGRQAKKQTLYRFG